MATVYVQYTDATKAEIMRVFCGPQDETAYPNQGTLLSSDAAYETYFKAQPDMISQHLPPITTVADDAVAATAAAAALSAAQASAAAQEKANAEAEAAAAAAKEAAVAKATTITANTTA